MSESTRHFGPEIQGAIYARGLSGERPAIPTSFPELEAAAKQKLSEDAFAYIAGGAGLETTMSANRRAFERVEINPSMLGGAGVRDLRTDLFGVAMPAPVMTAPIGVLDLFHPDADLAVARATAKLGLPMIISSQACSPMEEIATANGDGERFFQLYWGKSDEIAESFVRRAEKCGARAIFITLDTVILGWRPRDLNLASLPFLKARGIAQFTSDPVFRAMLSQAPEENPLGAAVNFTRIFSDPALNWDRIRKVRDWTKLPVVLKGIVRADDAARAVSEGFDGIVVSNHGGRQVDGAGGALAALPGVVAAVKGKVPVLFDSGIRCGADIFKALALGARAVCIGRPYVYGLTLEGEAGVSAVLEHLIAELDLTMALTGHASLASLNENALIPTA